MFSRITEELLFMFIIILTGSESKLYEYGLDNKELCKGRSSILQKLEDNDVIIMKGKTSGDNPPFSECTIKFSPSSKAMKTTTKIVFESFHIYDCGIYLLVQQSPSEFFDRELSSLFNFTCDSEPGKEMFYTKANNFILITLYKQDHTKLAYNFVFNISLTDAPPEPQFSPYILTGIGILTAIAVPGIICVLCKYLKIRRWPKRQEERVEELMQQSLSPLRRFPIGNSSESTNRYSSLPLGESSSAPSHPHTCIIDSIGPDGRCTVCNRMHENYAHIVSVNPDNQMGSTDFSNTCHLCHRSHEDFAHFVEIDGTTHVINDPVQSSSHSNRQTRCTGENLRHHRHHHHHHHSQDENRYQNSNNLVDEGQSMSDEDADLLENDLIPPSYDLAPPSYDEAIHMPKPNSHHVGGDNETDPLYQNIDHSGVTGS